MQQSNGSHDSLIAPSPIVPTGRPSSLNTSRSACTMSSLAHEPRQSRDTLQSSEHLDLRDENATDFTKFIESQGPITGSTGAREMLKAGQRRLRQLAQRPKKSTDPRSKAEESARQLLALQEGGFLPTNVAVPAGVPSKRSTHKKSLDSSRSSSRSISNLSFMANSRRDVESIGQPWLTDPLEKKDRPEAAVTIPPRFDDTNPPPYQPPVPAKDVKADAQRENQDPAVAITVADTTSGFKEKQSLGFSDAANPSIQVDSSEEQGPDTRSEDNVPKDEKASDNDQSGLKTDEGAMSPDLVIDSEVANKPATSSSGSSSTPTSQTTPSLKLFPDTMPPRNSSKGAWRISNARSLTLNRPLPASPDPEEQSSMDSNKESSQATDSTTVKEGCGAQEVSEPIPSTSADVGKSDKEPLANEKNSPKKGSRRPSSLPMCTIDAFPLPAPMRPLPSLPESNAASGAYSRSASSRSAPLARLVLDERNQASNAHDESAKATPAMSNSLLLVRAGLSRAERVHALKMRDMSASRLYLKESETPREEEEEDDQPPRSAKEPEEAMAQERGEAYAPRPESEKSANRNVRYQRKVASDPPSPPPLSPPPSKPSRHQISQSIGRRYCSTPLTGSAVLARDSEPQMLPASRDAPVRRSSSTRSVTSSHERARKEQDPVGRSDVPIPSSDDECTSASARQDQARPTSSRRRRMRPATLTMNEHRSHKMRATRRSSDYCLSPGSHRTRASGRASPQSHHTQSSYYSRDSRSSHHDTIRALEGRIAHLERQNKILQAALMAALDVGSVESLLGGSATSLSTLANTPATGRSFSSTNSSSLDESMVDDRRRSRRRQPPFRPTSWIASPVSSRRGSYDTEDSENVRELEDMIEDFDMDWMSERSNPSSFQMS
ncbi:hypothetical protein BO83DRAFT_249428 [Aspergillus eucalypticola CBS 122712]|uniref:Uncharacterized protein n=1 Tax=Aspergillus eucalypticola (strain CBS 122712 / IBT 29274) TaxID=1448314 RepID=A0A317VNJ8_ASPEC|nr:uncharacterized protein BO83DRAFT_249428 [Aspergillus eucalypticola CBS 122712]PWY75913.1 hypothetical protein BO83DRAFT_249428 [Aspergillus eucalypticola CBS 122712]